MQQVWSRQLAKYRNYTHLPIPAERFDVKESKAVEI